MKTKVLLAGATGYLGSYIAKHLLDLNFQTRLIVRDKLKIQFDTSDYEIVEAEVTKPKTISKVCDNIDVVISTIGITRQKDGLTYMDVDYQANVNLIDEAKKSGVKKFIYISVLNGENLRHLKICEAKEKLVDYLKMSGLDYCIIRPNGFFSDMKDFLNMAKGGRVYLFGNGKLKSNPIHGEDLARVCVDAMASSEKEIEVGGPDVYSQNEIAEMALNAFSKKKRISHLPDWIQKFTLWFVRTFTSPIKYGPIEFFLTVMSIEMLAPCTGENNLGVFFKTEAKVLI